MSGTVLWKLFGGSHLGNYIQVSLFALLFQKEHDLGTPSTPLIQSLGQDHR